MLMNAVCGVYREVAVDVRGGHGERVGRALHEQTSVGRALVAVGGGDGDAWRREGEKGRGE